MRYYNSNPNLTIVLPVNCNADCSFCSWKKSGQNEVVSNSKFINQLRTTMGELPSEFKQVTISGGEPSLYPYLEQVMEIISECKQITKVVFTTNGSKLYEIANKSWFTNVVNYINLSQHHHDQNFNIAEMGTRQLLLEREISELSEYLSGYGIPINFNCVLSDNVEAKYKLQFIYDFVDKAKQLGINSITFRADYFETTEPHYLESLLGKPMSVSSCDVCRKATYLVNGMNVNFTNSVFEPADVLGSDILYEAIIQPNGKITTDWAGKIELTAIEIDNSDDINGGDCLPPTIIKRIKSGAGCGSSGC